MILIISEINDKSTLEVGDWLESLALDFTIINDIPFDASCEIILQSNQFNYTLNGQSCFIDIQNLKRVWYRRGDISPVWQRNSLKTQSHTKFIEEIEHHLNAIESTTIIDLLVFLMNKKDFIGNYYMRNANKLISLLIASKVGLKIPISIVSSSKEELRKFYNSCDSTVTKGIQDVLSFSIDKTGYAFSTNNVAPNDIAEMADNFFPSLLQENVEKRYEIRSFYLRGEIYSMAIFSQQDEQTKVDYRNYNDEKPNRFVPFKLPEQIEKKIVAFMDQMKLDTGSLDLIVTPAMDYVFLEVNPCGQFGMVSHPCNYQIEKRIAEILAA